MAEQTQTRMTAADYFDLPQTPHITELIHGALIVSPTPIPKHQLIVGRIYALLTAIVPDTEVYFAPMSVYLDDDNVVEPDVLWASAEGNCEIGEKHLKGAPDLVVEVLSPSTARQDKREKFHLYEKFGVREYWIIDPAAEYIEVWVLDGAKFAKHGIYGAEDTFVSRVLTGQEISAAKVFGS